MKHRQTPAQYIKSMIASSYTHQAAYTHTHALYYYPSRPFFPRLEQSSRISPRHSHRKATVPTLQTTNSLFWPMTSQTVASFCFFPPTSSLQPQEQAIGRSLQQVELWCLVLQLTYLCFLSSHPTQPPLNFFFSCSSFFVCSGCLIVVGVFNSPHLLSPRAFHFWRVCSSRDWAPCKTSHYLHSQA